MIEAQRSEDWETYGVLSDSVRQLSASDTTSRYVIPEGQRQTYRSLGGVPHLDQNYTVFGEVIAGMEVVDSIATTPVNDLDRPLEDVRILRARLVVATQ